MLRDRIEIIIIIIDVKSRKFYYLLSQKGKEIDMYDKHSIIILLQRNQLKVYDCGT